MNKKRFFAALTSLVLAASMSGCAFSSDGLNPDKPVTIRVWHYYNGALKAQFDAMVNEFNSTVGMEKGIIVEGNSFGGVSDLEDAVSASINKEVGSEELPDIFASYSDMALVADKAGVLVSLDDYFSADELAEYVDDYIDEGRIGSDGKLKVLPVAKSTEVFMFNKTDWQSFSDETGITADDLATKEGLVDVSQKYYEWTDGLTPDIPDDGVAFYGRDSIANYMIIGAKQLGVDIISADGSGGAVINADEAAFRKLWDCYYVPCVHGWFTDYGKYRSDAVKVGISLAYTGSTSSAAYFPTEVTKGENTYQVEAQVIGAPIFEGGDRVNVSQGAGMTVTKTNKTHQAASAEFLKWFTGTEQNIIFSARSGYLPVTKEANEISKYSQICTENGVELDPITETTLNCAFDAVKNGRLYSARPFNGGTAARDILDSSLANACTAGMEKVNALMADGKSRDEAADSICTDADFQSWFTDIKAQLEATAAAE